MLWTVYVHAMRHGATGTEREIGHTCRPCPEIEAPNLWAATAKVREMFPEKDWDVTDLHIFN